MELALETSRRETSLALAAGGQVLLDEGAGAHASDLLPRLEKLLAQAGIGRSGPLALTTLFVGLGPGSYTGLRVGIATAHGLARATGAVLYGLSSFEALAFAELAPGEEGVVVADARGGRAYVARYRRAGGEPWNKRSASPDRPESPQPWAFSDPRKRSVVPPREHFEGSRKAADAVSPGEAQRSGGAERLFQGELSVLAEPAACAPAELEARCRGATLVLGHPGLREALGLALPPEVRYREDVRPRAGALLALGRARLAAGALAARPALEPLYLAEFAPRARA